MHVSFIMDAYKLRSFERYIWTLMSDGHMQFYKQPDFATFN